MEPQKLKAWRGIVKALSNGTLKRGRCWCGETGQAHHTDYSKPLEVEWLCHRHHVEEHGKKCHKDKRIKIDDLRDYQRQYHRKYHKTAIGLAIRARYRERNREKIRAKSRDYYWSHREKMLAQSSAYTAAHYDKTLAYQRAYRAKKRAERQSNSGEVT